MAQLRSWMNTRKLLSVRRKESYNWHINKDFDLRNAKNLITLRKCLKRLKQFKLVKVLEKFFAIVKFYEMLNWKFRTSLQKVVVNLNSSNDVEKSWNYSNVCTGSVWKMLQKLNKNK